MPAAELKFSPAIQRIYSHKEDDWCRAEIPVRDASYRAEFEKHPEAPAALRFGYGFAAFLENKRILIHEYDLLAGYPYRYSYDTAMPVVSDLDFDPRFCPDIGMEPHREAADCLAVLDIDPASERAETLNWFAVGVNNWLFKHWESGHIIPAWTRLLEKGFGGIMEEGRAALETANDEQKMFIESMLLCGEAAERYIGRYEAEARRLAAESADPEMKRNLERIAAACAQVKSGPARTFFEAVQLLWFAHEMLLGESFPASISLGRLDQILLPWYEADRASGALTPQDAEDIIDALWMKFAVTLRAFQNVTIGGVDAEGNYMVNDLTCFFIRATRKFKSDQPLLSLRYAPNLPDELWDEAVALLRTGTGFPAFFNDTACVKAKKKMGFTDEDAWNYAPVGCVEISVEGREYAKTEVLRVNWLKVLELMLNDGKCTLSQDTIKPFTSRNLDEIRSFEDFYAWYKDELVQTAKRAMAAVNDLDAALPHCYPTPFMSLMMEGCITKGMDVTGGGTFYNNTSCNACGESNTADALMAIKKLVFDEKKLTLSKLAEAAYADFEGYGDVLRMIEDCPKFGNDIEEVDVFVKELTALFSEAAHETRTARGGRYQVGLYTVEDHAWMGKVTGGTVDGRRAGTTMANGVCPAQGRDAVGPTAVVNSLTKTDLLAATNGMVLDLKFSPAFLAEPTHQQALKYLIETYFDLGGQEVQFNVIDRETLIDAQKNPDKHRNLVVRVSGFSAHFTTLGKNSQDDIIRRTEYSNF